MTDDDRTLREALHGIVAEPYVPSGLADSVAESYGRRRRRRGAATAAATALGVGVLVAVPALSRPLRTATPVASASPSRPPAPDGRRIEGTATVLAAPGRPVRLCPPRGTLFGAGWDDDAGPPECRDGIPAVGIDLAALDHRQEKDGTVWGGAWVLGVHADGTFTVIDQGPPRQRPEEQWLSSVPCPEPPGGWRKGSPSLKALAAYSKAHPDAIVHERYARPKPGHAVLVVAAVGAARVTADLRAAYGSWICVVESKYTKAQVAATREAMSELWQSDGLGAGNSGTSCCGYTGSPDGQVKIGMEVDFPTPEIDAFVAAQPEGLVKVEYWLAPVVEVAGDAEDS